MRKTGNLPFKNKIKHAVVVDGECEAWYVQMIKRNEGGVPFDLKPRIPQRKKVDEQYQLIVELAKDYDKVFWIIDCDVISAESRLTPKGIESEQQKLEKHIARLLKTHNQNVVIIKNNPCLEYWLLLHFEDTAAPFANCEEAGKRLKKKLATYEKSQGYYTKQDNDIYLQLKRHLPTAIKHARKIYKQSAGNKDASVSEMYRLFEELGLVEKED